MSQTLDVEHYALVKIRAHTSYVNPTMELLQGLLQSIERIADEALAAHVPAPQGEQACIHGVNCYHCRASARFPAPLPAPTQGTGWSDGFHHGCRHCGQPSELHRCPKQGSQPAPLPAPTRGQNYNGPATWAKAVPLPAPTAGWRDITEADEAEAADQIEDLKTFQAAPQGAGDWRDTAAKYQELIYAVGNKHQGENRHETALRYIRQAEMNISGAASGKEQR